MWQYAYMRTLVDIDDEALDAAAEILGTSTKKDTVNAALAFVVQRRRHLESLLNEPADFGVGSDIADEEIMRQARR